MPTFEVVHEVKFFDRDGTALDRISVGNETPDEFLNNFLDVIFGNETKYSSWYVAIMGTDHTGTASDTYANSMSTANYESTDYSESARPAYNTATASSQQITNSADPAIFTMGGTDTPIYGSCLVSSATKDDNSSGQILASIAKWSTSATIPSALKTVSATIALSIASTTA